MDFEIFRESALKSAFFEAKDSAEKEHVTPFIYRQPERFRLGNLQERRDLSHFRLTVDTPEDFELISRIITELYPQKPEFSLADIMQTLQKHPDWAEINASIRQKEVG
jgi:spore coat polysaccharide biosynthesis protein SpsF